MCGAAGGRVPVGRGPRAATYPPCGHPNERRETRAERRGRDSTQQHDPRARRFSSERSSNRAAANDLSAH
eukprot:3771483-Prymnesium_polylepis.1